MAAVATTSALSNLLKRLYQSRDLSNQALRRTPFFRAITRKDDLRGEGIYIPYNYGLPPNGSANFARAQANVQTSQVARWFVERKKYYGFHTISGEAIHASKGNEASFLEIKLKELDEVVKYMGQQIGEHAWGDGTGLIGQISTDPGTGNTGTVTLSDIRNAVKIHIGQELIANVALTGNTNRTDRYRVTGVNRGTGVISLTRTSGGSHDWAASDYIFVDGNHGVAGGSAVDNSMITGVQAWIPSADPSTTLLGMTRTDDPTMKAGWRGSWQGTIEESAKALAADMGQYLQSEASGLWLSRYNWFRLEQELTSKNRKVMDARATEYFGTPALALLTPEGEVPVMADPFCPNDAGFLLDHSSWELHHMLGVPHLVTDDGNEALRMSDDDGIEVRFRAFLELVCFRPFTNGRFTIS
jgi:hypothetical protein